MILIRLWLELLLLHLLFLLSLLQHGKLLLLNYLSLYLALSDCLLKVVILSSSSLSLLHLALSYGFLDVSLNLFLIHTFILGIHFDFFLSLH